MTAVSPNRRLSQDFLVPHFFREKAEAIRQLASRTIGLISFPDVLFLQEVVLADFFSNRFGKNVWLTHHARASMLRRGIDVATLERVIEEGEIKRRDVMNLWIFKHIVDRADNLICAAVAEQTAVVVKTVMINWELEEDA